MTTAETTVLIAGAARGLGRELVKVVTEAEIPTIALIRTPNSRADLETMGAQVVLADALDSQGLKTALTAIARSPLAIISTLGGTGAMGDQPRSDYLGNRNLIDVAQTLPCDRWVLVSSIGAGESVVALPDQVLTALRPALVEKEKAEAYLQASGLRYTIVRPGGLTTEPPTGTGILTEDPTISGRITRADVAALILACLRTPNTEQRVFSAVDRDRLSGNQPITPFPLN
ncbi:MAG: SDR family oxidoreductase [Leptolyngbyaceae cyanobacterium T60_A2020_046]|nr:SDR family oxidoreductase [Leptolyngbyaceae cyanobacterium T60_A2020_046]